MLRNSIRAILAFLVLGCRGGAPSGAPTPEQDLPRPLSGFATQRLILAPASHVRADSLGWVQQAGGARGMARRLDTVLATHLDSRGLAQRWILPAELVRTFERNRSYATDPYQLSVEPLRLASFKTGEKYGEPLSSQLRTMIALEEDTRYVLMPIELRFDRVTGAVGQRASLRLALLDPRLAEARWVADVRSEVTSDTRTALEMLASRVADLFVAP